MPDGEWISRMHIKMAMHCNWQLNGIQRIVITGSSSEPVEARLNKLGILNVYQQVKNKQSLHWN